VISLMGDRHASRVGGSLLSAAGHPEWIASNDEDWLRAAVAVASDRAALHRIRLALRDDLQRSALLDHSGQAARFGAALRACWASWCAQAAS
jgi:protein O-GlcNAc transferase